MRRTQRGITVLHYATGGLKVIVNELEVEELAAEDSGDAVCKHVCSSFVVYTEKKLPQAIENGNYDKDVMRKKGEGMLKYVTRRHISFNELTKEGWDIPPLAKGYILMRVANLLDKARDLVEMSSGGDYKYEGMQRYLKRLERPIPGS